MENSVIEYKKLLNNIWYTLTESIWLSCQHWIQPEYCNSTLPNYSGIVAIRFGIIERVGNWSFLPFNDHGSTEILGNDKMEEHTQHPLRLPTTVIMKHTFFNSKSLKTKYSTLHSEHMMPNQMVDKRNTEFNILWKESNDKSFSWPPFHEIWFPCYVRIFMPSVSLS